MFEQLDQTENEFRNIKLKLKGPNRHSELQAVKALMAMSAQHNVAANQQQQQQLHLHQHHNLSPPYHLPQNQHHHNAHLHHQEQPINTSSGPLTNGEAGLIKEAHSPIDLVTRVNDSSDDTIYGGLAITMTEEEFRELAEREGIKDVIGEPICRLCNNLFSGPLGIALHMCPAMKRQTYRCDICGEDKWKTKANLHSHIKWCKKRLNLKTSQNEKQIY